MKKSVATALVALAALATPLAIGQSQGLTIDPVVREMTGTAHTVQVKASSFFAPRQSATSDFGVEKPGFNPDPATSWLMALAIFGIIAVRRMRG